MKASEEVKDMLCDLEIIKAGLEARQKKVEDSEEDYRVENALDCVKEAIDSLGSARYKLEDLEEYDYAGERFD